MGGLPWSLWFQDQSLPIYGDGLYTRDWIHVEDHCAALETILGKGKPGEVYNIGGDSERNMTPEEEVWAKDYIRELRERQRDLAANEALRQAATKAHDARNATGLSTMGDDARTRLAATGGRT